MTKNGQPTPLAPLAFPLVGSHLIEASAGTGKTYTIAMLYVRLVLGHGGGSAFPGGPLTPPDILVVTFTEAATEELRDRIRTRLAEAAARFREDPAGIRPPDDPDPLHDLRAGYPPDQWPVCARRLELAAEWMDEAAVSTIHGWCNRMLREHAFDSGSPFVQNLETDQRALAAETVRDYWRTFVYPLDQDGAATFLACWSAPDALQRVVGPLLGHADRLPEPDGPANVLRAMREERQQRLAELKRPWAAWSEELRDLFDKAKAAKAIDGRKMRSDWYGNWLDALRDWATMPDREMPDLGKGWDRLKREGIADAWTKGTPPDHPAFEAISRLKPALAALPNPKPALLAHAVRWIARTLDEARRRRAEIDFDDLLTGLDAALRGPLGNPLADIIRRQFPVALVDEFQDTDPVQYRIFERVYQVEENRQDCALVLIGDPKQAIYAFRGADIHTYLKARRAVGNRVFTLDTNFRSTGAMVEAANHCFRRAEEEEGGNGAFRFRSEAGNPVPFHAAKARGRQDAFEIDGERPPAMTLAVVAADGGLSKTAYVAHMAAACATQVVAWLEKGQAARAGFRTASGDLVPLRTGDIAILVTNGTEAGAMRQALARRGVRSVYLSEKGTVYESLPAGEVHRWLAACAEPDDGRLLRAALSTPSLGLSLAELDALNTDEEAWEARVVQFQGYREVWQRQGVLPMLRRMLGDFRCNDRLLDLAADAHGNSGERILTDILHLAELLQKASAELEGEHALVRYLAEQIADPEGDAEGRQLRLESDADLVKVVTVYKAKGLEYPVVFLPFVCATRVTKRDDVPLKWHDDEGGLRIALEPEPEALARADEDRLGEDLRKLYVALTRARHAIWAGLGPVRTDGPGAVGHLFGLDGVAPGGYLEAVKAFAEGCPGMAVEADPPVDDRRFIPAAPAAAAGQACRPVRAAREDWRIHSYSALRVDGHGLSPASPPEDTAQAANLLEGQREVRPAAAGGNRATEPIHRFFQGAEAGTFLHDLMEWVAGAGFAAVLEDRAALRDTIARRCKVRRWERWVDELLAWIERLLTTSLPLGPPAAGGLRLSGIANAKAEMEFWFETRHVDLARLDSAVVAHTLGGRERPPLAPERVNGMLKGFMDLVFEHEGRYYVADYKSNWLGPTDAHYTAAAMDEAIRAHRYDLQYAIYLFALHRLLGSRLPDYDYDRHVGGAVYLFLRGIGAETAGVHFERPPRALMDILDGLFSGRAGAE